MSKILRGFIGSVPGTCGLGVITGFKNPSEYVYTLRSRNLARAGGIGYSVAGFVNEGDCKAVYEYIKKTYTIVFQSPVKRNTNSGRQFFFIVFKEKDKQ